MNLFVNLLKHVYKKIQKKGNFYLYFQFFEIFFIRKPTGELLQLKFFRLAKNKEYIKEKIIKRIDPLDQRVQKQILKKIYFLI